MSSIKLGESQVNLDCGYCPKLCKFSLKGIGFGQFDSEFVSLIKFGDS